jgi:molybdopterin-binding protein
MPEAANRESPAICEDRIKIWLNVKSNRVMSSSIRNRLPGTIERIVSDKVVSEVVIRTAAGEVTSVITTGSVQRMNLKEGDQVFAIIKATEVSVEKE